MWINWARCAGVLGSALLIGSVACSTQQSPTSTRTAALAADAIALPAIDASVPEEAAGLHNLVTFHEGFVSGGVPDPDAGFETLSRMGVKTIISVDGAVPEVARAKSLGMRYIHLPIGYSGFDEHRKLELVRATRDAIQDGPVYIHCHHGKHRSAGAAATVAVSLGWMTVEEGVARMKVSGTSPSYTGLYACAREAVVLKASEIESVPAEFPEVSKPSNFVHGMLEIDEVYDHLKAIQKAGWTVPKNHPDIVPVAEAGRLADLYRVLREDRFATERPADFSMRMQHAQEVSQQLEDGLAAASPDPVQLTAQFSLVAASCKDCHAAYRD
jgi:protein tyrosine phosphatase (PTP) superfamily phosphohydrolase (DUF442 family)